VCWAYDWGGYVERLHANGEEEAYQGVAQRCQGVWVSNNDLEEEGDLKTENRMRMEEKIVLLTAIRKVYQRDT